MAEDRAPDKVALAAAAEGWGATQWLGRTACAFAPNADIERLIKEADHALAHAALDAGPTW